MPERGSKPSLCICIIGLNQARIIRPLLEQASTVADEIVFVDGGSGDGTEEIVRSFSKARFFRRTFDQNFAKQRNYAIAQSRSDWILFLDTDELIGPNLIALLPTMLRSSFQAFKLPIYWLAGENPPVFVRAPTLYPSRNLRLFRNLSHIRYDESRPLHERIPDAACQPLHKIKRAHILHYSFIFQTREEREQKVARYNSIHSHLVNNVYLFEDLPHRLIKCREGWIGGQPWVQSWVDIFLELARLSLASCAHPAQC